MDRLPPAKETWEKALGELQLQVSKTNYTTWLKDSQGVRWLTDENEVFVVGVPDTFVAEWLSKRFHSLVKKTLAVITGRDIEVQFTVCPPALSPGPLAAGLESDGGTSTRTRKYKLNPKYTFDKFIVGDCNRLAFAAAEEVSKNPACVYNPLIIHSDNGQGKTHLLHAIGHASTRKGLKVAYSGADEFTSEFVLALKRNDLEQLQGKFTPINVFLFDDFQLLDRKKQTQQFFFHTFNELYNNNCQVVIAADRLPKEMHLISNRLKTHLEWGLVAQIQPPDFETRLAILRAKSQEKSLPIAEEILRVIAQRIQDNVCHLEGALTYLDARTKLTGLELTPQIVNKLLTSNNSIDDRKVILQITASYFDCSVEQLIGQKRDRETTLARHIAMYLMREEGNYSFAEISRALGNKNHATVIHGYKKISGELKDNSRLRKQITEIKQKIDNSC